MRSRPDANQVGFILRATTQWQRGVLARNGAMSGASAAAKGTALHTRVQNRIRLLDIDGLSVNQRLYGTSTFRSPSTGDLYEFRIPDFLLRKPTGNSVFDIKPEGTPMAGPQFIDFGRFANTTNVQWITYQSY